MPRRKVRPENRKRATKACSLCKASKIRCDARLPCGACIRRDRPAACSFESGAATESIRSPSERNVARRGSKPDVELETLINPDPERATPFYLRYTPMSETVSSASNGSALTPQLTLAGSEPDRDCAGGDKASPTDRFIINSANGEQVYVGETASLSFLHFLQRTLRQYTGTTPFTSAELHNVMLEVDAEEAEGNVVEPTSQQKEVLFRCYNETTGALLHLFTAEEAAVLLSGNPNSAFSPGTCSNLRREDNAAFNMALAIGAQARASSRLDAQYAATYSTNAQRVAFEGMLAYPSLSMVRLFVLMAFYNLSACRQNAAFVYLGVAAKTAIVLGLHRPMSWNDHPKDERALRLRTWNSLCVLDVLTSSILGRPSTVPRARRPPGQLDEGEPDQVAFLAILRACSLLEDVIKVLDRDTIIETQTAEAFLNLLRKWSRQLPDNLRQCSYERVPSGKLADTRLMLANMHVSCVYYFSVILVTRPFLIMELMSRIHAENKEIAPNSKAPNGATDQPKVAELAEVCIGSATYMAELCDRAILQVPISDLPFGSLGLLKAWLFGSALILGLAVFAGELRQEIREAFSGARRVLKRFSVTCPQARSYDDILGSFSETISQYRRTISRRTVQKVDQYLDRILVIAPAQTGIDSPGNTFAPIPLSPFADLLGARSRPNDEPAPLLAFEENTEPAAVVMDAIDWMEQQQSSDIAMQFSDNFAIDFSLNFLASVP